MSSRTARCLHVILPGFLTGIATATAVAAPSAATAAEAPLGIAFLARDGLLGMALFLPGDVLLATAFNLLHYAGAAGLAALLADLAGALGDWLPLALTGLCWLALSAAWRHLTGRSAQPAAAPRPAGALAPAAIRRTAGS